LANFLFRKDFFIEGLWQWQQEKGNTIAFSWEDPEHLDILKNIVPIGTEQKMRFSEREYAIAVF